MIRIVTTYFLLMICLDVLAQSNDIQAKAAFLSAQEAYGNGDYAGSIEKLEYVKELLGATNPRVEHLLANAYLEMGDYDKVQKSLTAYFELAADSDANYLQMIRMVETTKLKKKESDEKSLQLAKDEQAWHEASTQNTILSYDQYVQNFPSGIYTEQARHSKKKAAFLAAQKGSLELEYYSLAVNYALEEKTDLDKALEWLAFYLTDEKRSQEFWVVHLKAQVLYSLGRTKEAINEAELSMKLAAKNKGGDFGYVKRNEDFIKLIKNGK